MKFLTRILKNIIPKKNKENNTNLAPPKQIKILIRKLSKLEEQFENYDQALSSHFEIKDRLISSIRELVNQKENLTDIQGFLKEQKVLKDEDTQILDDFIELIDDIGNIMYIDYESKPFYIISDYEHTITEVKYRIIEAIEILKSNYQKIHSSPPSYQIHELSELYQQTRESIRVVWHYIGFFTTLTTLVIFIGFPLLQGEGSCEATCDSTEWYDTLTQSIISKLTIGGVLAGTLLFFAWQILNKGHIKEGYRHKEIMLKAFISFSSHLSDERRAFESTEREFRRNERIEKIDDASHKLTIDTIKSIGENPAESTQYSGMFKKIIRKILRTTGERIESSITDAVSK